MKQKGHTAAANSTDPTLPPVDQAPLKRQRVLSESQSPPPHAPALPTPTAMPPAPHNHLEQPCEDEGKARKSVFGNVELRQKIFGLLDRSSLLSFQRVDKIAVAGVAQVIYRKIPESLVSRMSRSSPRREIYADAVRIISRSPPPSLTRKVPTSYYSEGKHVERESLLDMAYALRMAYHNLHTIEYRNSENDTDDAYFIHLQGDDEVTVAIERHVHFDMSRYTGPPEAGSSLVARPRSYFGESKTKDTSLSISLAIHHRSSTDSCEALNADLAERWKTWLFHNPKLDKRVASIEIPDILRAKMGITDDDVLTFLARRREEKCEPVTRLQISLAGGRVAKRVLAYSALVGPELRTLHLDATGAENPDWPSILAICSSSFPHLDTLTLSNQLSPIEITKPLFGLPNLHSLHIVDKRPRRGYRESMGFDPCILASNLSGVGAQDCIFRVLDETPLAKGFHSVIRKVKRSPQQYGYLRTTSLHDLDLWDPDAVLKGSFNFPPGEEVRRTGWSTVATTAADFNDRKLELLSLFEQGKAAVEGFHSLLVGTLDELAGTEGNVHAQGDILSRRFKEIDDTQEDKMAGALQALTRKTHDLIRAAHVARKYADLWQTKQRIAAMP